MAEITPERQQQLTEEYAQLKEKILDVDHKYSLSYYEPELEFEPSLGLEKLTFTPLTETELQQLAQQEVNPRYLEKQRSLDKSYATAKANVLLSVDRQTEKHRKNLVKLADQYAEDYKKRQHALANGGMWHSSAAEKALKSIDDAYDGDVEEENKRYTAEYEALYDKLDALEDSYEQGSLHCTAETAGDSGGSGGVGGKTGKKPYQHRKVQQYGGRKGNKISGKLPKIPSIRHSGGIRKGVGGGEAACRAGRKRRKTADAFGKTQLLQGAFHRLQAVRSAVRVADRHLFAG